MSLSLNFEKPRKRQYRQRITWETWKKEIDFCETIKEAMLKKCAKVRKWNSVWWLTRISHNIATSLPVVQNHQNVLWKLEKSVISVKVFLLNIPVHRVVYKLNHQRIPSGWRSLKAILAIIHFTNLSTKCLANDVVKIIDTTGIRHGPDNYFEVNFRVNDSTIEIVRRRHTCAPLKFW